MSISNVVAPTGSSAVAAAPAAAQTAGSVFAGLLAAVNHGGAASVPTGMRHLAAAVTPGVPAAHGSGHRHATDAAATAAAATPAGDSGALASSRLDAPQGDEDAATAAVDGSAQSTADALGGDLMRSIQAYVSGGQFTAASLSVAA